MGLPSRGAARTVNLDSARLFPLALAVCWLESLCQTSRLVSEQVVAVSRLHHVVLLAPPVHELPQHAHLLGGGGLEHVRVGTVEPPG